VFFDEVGFSFLEPVGHTWAPCGKPPVLRRVTYGRRVLSTAVGLTISGRIYKRHFNHAINSEAVVETLKHLRRHTRGPLIVVWDRASIHRGKKVMAYLAEHPAIHVEWLPPCAPDINPEEFCHGNVKARMKNAMPMNREEIRNMANNGFARLRHRPDLIISFIHHAGLSVKQLW
jgi:transposase